MILPDALTLKLLEKEMSCQTAALFLTNSHSIRVRYTLGGSYLMLKSKKAIKEKMFVTDTLKIRPLPIDENYFNRSLHAV